MAKNKITFRVDRRSDERNEYTFVGSVREPTLTEIQTFIVENRLQEEIDDYFMVCAIKGSVADEDNPPFFDDEPNKAVKFWGYSGGKGEGSCPICGHERDFSGEECPTCFRRWGE